MFLDGICTALAPRQTASQQHVSKYFKDREEPLVDKEVVETNFSKFRAERKTQNDQIQILSAEEAICANAICSDCFPFLVSRGRLQVQRRSETSQ